MKISIITVFPELYDSFLKLSLVARAIENKLIEVDLVRFSDMCEPKVRIDSPTCGPGAGMIIKPEVVQKAIEKCEKKNGKGFKVFFSPQGRNLSQNLLKVLSDKVFDFGDNSPESECDDKICREKKDHIILVCARYEGMDERVEKFYADLILSIGDYVLMGGDLPAQVFLEGLLRLMPGVVGRAESVEEESFSGPFLDYPSYTLPVDWQGMKVPSIVQSGNHAEIEKWRTEKAAEKTIFEKFDWFVSNKPGKQDLELGKKFVPNHYVALMHTQILVKSGEVGNTSITSLDIHDIARSCATYGISNYFMVSALIDQRKILNTFLDFWLSNEGKEYNSSRFEAVKRVVPASNLDDVVAKIKEKEGVEPLIITTSAKKHELEGGKAPEIIDYFSQGEVFKQKRPVLFIFGTGQGLADEVLERSDYLLLPVNGMTEYNHLSVRSAAAIILDRWLGLHTKIVKDIN